MTQTHELGRVSSKHPRRRLGNQGPSFTDLTKTCVGRMGGLTAITVGLRPRYVTIFIVMDVAAGRRAVNKYVHSLGVAPLPRLRRLPCVLLTHINHWDAW